MMGCIDLPTSCDTVIAPSRCAVIILTDIHFCLTSLNTVLLYATISMHIVLPPEPHLVMTPAITTTLDMTTTLPLSA